MTPGVSEHLHISPNETTCKIELLLIRTLFFIIGASAVSENRSEWKCEAVWEASECNPSLLLGHNQRGVFREEFSGRGSGISQI